MNRLKWRVATTFLLHYIVLNSSVTQVFAGNPYFYLSGPSEIFSDSDNNFTLYLEPDGETITAAQISVDFDFSVISNTAFLKLGSQCSFWAPASPSLGYGNQVTPYLEADNSVLVACGFSNPGYDETDPAKILTINFFPNNDLEAGTTTTISLNNPLFRYIGNTIPSGTNIGLTLTSYDASQAAAPVPTPTPGLPAPDTLTSSDLTFVDIGSGSAGTFSGSTSSSTLNPNALAGLENSTISILDDSIPPPPANIIPREAITPRPAIDPDQKEGNVLSLQSLKELLVPGKSDADRTVVLINLLSTLAFLIILIILIWRLIMSRRLSKIKSEHIKDMLQGELSALEAKVTGGEMLDSEDLNQKLEDLKQDLESL